VFGFCSPAEEGWDGDCDHHHDVVIYCPFVAGDVAIVLFTGVGVESQQLVDSGFSGPKHVTALAEHPQKQE
jgi:hypothetical protein